MVTRNYIVATAGHVDHGKSALVKALTGSDPDRLPEEKARGITIDLGFANLRLTLDSRRASVLQTPLGAVPHNRRLQDRRPTAAMDAGQDSLIATSPAPTSALTSAATANVAPVGGYACQSEDTSASVLNLGIVDVPGHEDFVKNMVAGIGAIDAALFVVAADDGWMPQSEEHLHILDYAGVRHGVIALTKVDRLEPAARAEAIAALQTKIAGTALTGMRIVPTSVLTGEGIESLRVQLAECLVRSPGPKNVGRPRLWVDRAFSLRGIGTVVTGSLRGGEFAAGQTVAIAGRDSTAKIRTIHRHNSAQPNALPGTRAALNLVGVAAGGLEGPAVIARGDLVTLPEWSVVFDTCDVWLRRAAVAGRPGGLDGGLLHGAIVRLHVGTASVPCRVVFADRPTLRGGESALAQLRLEAPLPVVDGEHVILRDSGERMTLAGGVILEVGTRRSRFRSAAHQEFLAAQAVQPDDCPVWLQAKLRRDGFATVNELRRTWRFGDAEIAAATERFAISGTTVRGKGWVGWKARWVALKQMAEQRIAAHEREHPTQNGLPLTQLRLGLGYRLSPELFDGLVAELCTTVFETVGAAIRHREFRPSLPPGLQRAAEEVSAVLRHARLNPPSRKDLGRTVEAADALEFLVKTGRVIALTPDIAIAGNVYHAATRAVCDHLAVHGRATVSELKQALGTSRRVMVPLLERMDRDGLTLRDGEYRVLRKASMDAGTLAQGSAVL